MSVTPFFVGDDLQFLLTRIDAILRVRTRETTEPKIRHRGAFSLGRVFSGKLNTALRIIFIPHDICRGFKPQAKIT